METEKRVVSMSLIDRLVAKLQFDSQSAAAGAKAIVQKLSGQPGGTAKWRNYSYFTGRKEEHDRLVQLIGALVEIAGLAAQVTCDTECLGRADKSLCDCGAVRIQERITELERLVG